MTVSQAPGAGAQRLAAPASSARPTPSTKTTQVAAGSTTAAVADGPGEASGVILVDPRRMPVRVAQLEWSGPTLSGVPGAPGGDRVHGADAADGRVLALVRVHGCPLGFVQVDGPGEDEAGMLRLVVDAARRELGALIDAYTPSDANALSSANALASEVSAGDVSAGEVSAADVSAADVSTATLPLISVVICTRDRTPDLARCLDSVLRLEIGRAHV